MRRRLAIFDKRYHQTHALNRCISPVWEIFHDTAGSRIDQKSLLIISLISSGAGLGQYLSGNLLVGILICFNRVRFSNDCFTLYADDGWVFLTIYIHDNRWAWSKANFTDNKRLAMDDCWHFRAPSCPFLQETGTMKHIIHRAPCTKSAGHVSSKKQLLLLLWYEEVGC